MLAQLLNITKELYGDIFTYSELGKIILDHLNRNGIKLAMTNRDVLGEVIVQKSGLIALAGVIRAINAGLISSGESVLCSFSGGAANGNFIPCNDEVILLSERYDESLSRIIEDVKQRRSN